MKLDASNGELVLSMGLVDFENWDSPAETYTLTNIKDLQLLQEFLTLGKPSSIVIINNWFFQKHPSGSVYININDTVREALVNLDFIKKTVYGCILHQQVCNGKQDTKDFWKIIYHVEDIDTLKGDLLEMVESTKEIEFQYTIKDPTEMKEVLPLVRKLPLYKRGWRDCDISTPMRYETYTLSEGIYLTLVGELKKQALEVYVIKIEVASTMEHETLLSRR